MYGLFAYHFNPMPIDGHFDICTHSKKYRPNNINGDSNSSILRIDLVF